MNRLYAISPPARLDEIEDFFGVDCWSIIRIDHPTSDWSYCGPVTVEMGPTETIHDLWIFGSGILFDCAGVDR